MRVDLFDFTLPPGKIAQQPVSPRHAAKLLVVRGAALSDARVYDLPKILNPGDLLIFNNSKVIPAALNGTIGKRKVKFNLHKRQGESAWWAFAKPAKYAVAGAEVRFAEDFTARIKDTGDFGERLLEFNDAGDFGAGDFWRKLEANGTMPLPPYIKRDSARPEDRHDYQTVFAEKPGAVAAPTAGLHFSEALLQELTSAGIETACVTLHVGGGTFLPVRADDTADHKMHGEYGEVSQAVCDKIAATRKGGGKIIAVGTTSLRILEAAAQAPNNKNEGVLKSFAGETDIFITPGFRFAVADLLLTNFHLPRSTLFMLVSAFSGLDIMQAAYAYAIKGDYRFFSYGDACLLERNDAI